MNKETGQIQESERRHKYREDLDPQKARLAYMALSQLEMALRGKPNFRCKFHMMASSKKQQNRMPRETEKHSLKMIGGKQIGGQRLGGRNQDGCGTTKSGDFLSQDFTPT